ncbi:F-box/kelch-repeat protein At3g06240-like [Cornus florida]|uniref:F-box/kelch-repeat protein At3g06240-like n=1 Tax=Cornus florida TaxID=4283 RepID=UPI00289640EC|nr:F-box/kelch-repeat protein At3g06240-like [Cornus florida]
MELKANREKCGGGLSYLLPDNVVFLIFLKLSVKSLLRIRCVSKSWRSCISDPNFIKTHVNVQSHRRLLTISPLQLGYSLHSINLEPTKATTINDIEELKITDILDIEPCGDEWLKIIGSCNGLVCILYDKSFSFRRLYIVNPSTRVSKKVPKFDFWYWMTSETYGFGYDHTVDDYKLLKAHKDNVHIYSLKTNSWKKAQSCFPRDYYEPIGTLLGTTLNGAIHWLCIDLEQQQPPLVIVGFSLADEKFWKSPVPIGFPRSPFELGVFRGCLCVLSRNNGDFWVMEEYGETQSWTKVVIETPSFNTENLVLPRSDELLKNDELLFATDFGKFVLWNTRERTSRDLILPGIQDANRYKFLRVGGYVESLVSPIMGV